MSMFNTVMLQSEGHIEIQCKTVRLRVNVAFSFKLSKGVFPVMKKS